MFAVCATFVELRHAQGGAHQFAEPGPIYFCSSKARTRQAIWAISRQPKDHTRKTAPMLGAPKLKNGAPITRCAIDISPQMLD